MELISTNILIAYALYVYFMYSNIYLVLEKRSTSGKGSGKLS